MAKAKTNTYEVTIYGKGEDGKRTEMKTVVAALRMLVNQRGDLLFTRSSNTLYASESPNCIAAFQSGTWKSAIAVQEML